MVLLLSSRENLKLNWKGRSQVSCDVLALVIKGQLVAVKCRMRMTLLDRVITPLARGVHLMQVWSRAEVHLNLKSNRRYSNSSFSTKLSPDLITLILHWEAVRSKALITKAVSVTIQASLANPRSRKMQFTTLGAVRNSTQRKEEPIKFPNYKAHFQPRWKTLALKLRLTRTKISLSNLKAHHLSARRTSLFQIYRLSRRIKV
jgi:hypothetical protein